MPIQLTKRLRKRIRDCVMSELAAAFVGRLRKPLLTMSAGTMLGVAVIAPNVALAFGPPPPLPAFGGAPPPPAFGGAPPAPGLAGAPPAPRLGGAPGLGRVAGPAGLSRLGGPPGASRLAGGGRGAQGALREVQGRSAGYSNAGRSAVYSYRSSGYGHYGYDRSGYRYGRAAAYAYGAAAGYAYGAGGSYTSDGCYYTSRYSYRRGAYRRVLVCSGS